MFSRNIPMAEKRIVRLQSKKVKICSFFYYIYLKRYLEIFVTNIFQYILEVCFKIYCATSVLLKNKYISTVVILPLLTVPT